MSKNRDNAGFPTSAQVLEFIRDSAEPVGKREIARAFNIRGTDRARLNDILRELRSEGELDRGRGRRFARPGTLPGVGVVEITGIDRDGDLVGRPVVWNDDGNPPAIHFAPDTGKDAPAVGDRVLARLAPNDDGTYSARIIKRLEAAPQRILGVFRMVGGRGRVIPTNRRIRTEFTVPAGMENGASANDLVVAQAVGGRSMGMPEAKIVDRIGDAMSPRAPSLIAIHTNDIPTEFTAGALRDADRAKAVALAGRTDLRDLPLVTIDGADARDFDDAVHAEADTDPANPDGWKLTVAIADVAWYVRPGAPLDESAYERGNSVYFPDMVVPMLPEALSNGLCSLVPHEERGCLAVRMRVDRDGNLFEHKFLRGLMRSAARLTYEQVEAARGGEADETTAPLLETVIAPLYGAFEALLSARQRRGAIDLDLPERRVVLDGDGRIVNIVPVQRLDSHRLIEEFMISANVAAAETLERLDAPCMFRLHDQPSLEKVEGLRQTLASVGMNFARGQVVKPELFQRIVSQVAGKPEAHTVNMSVLRAQAQAEYGPSNIGHFGLALRHYAHFTSPIRRYSDLLVHRSLITALGLGEGGLRPEDGARFAELGKHVSFTERRAVDAERDAVDRYTTIFMSDRIGAQFTARVNGVHRAGLFVSLDETGADGLVPMSMMGNERFDFDSEAQKIEGRASGISYRVGSPVEVTLEEANVHTGSLVFSLLSDGRRPTRRARTRPEGTDPSPAGKPGPKGKGQGKSKRKNKGKDKNKGKPKKGGKATTR